VERRRRRSAASTALLHSGRRVEVKQEKKEAPFATVAALRFEFAAGTLLPPLFSY